MNPVFLVGFNNIIQHYFPSFIVKTLFTARPVLRFPLAKAIGDSLNATASR